MKQLLEQLQDIMTNGVDISVDDSGKGRRRVIGAQKRFDLSGGKLPVVTTRKVNPMFPIYEMMMFIFGITNIEYLHQYGCRIWDKWAVSNASVVNYFQKLVERGLLTEEQAAFQVQSMASGIVGDVGPVYGAMWRDWPRARQDIHILEVTRTVADLPSDRMTTLKKAWDEMPAEEKEGIEFSQFAIRNYYSTIDQLNELVLNLKSDPYSSRHIVSSVNPSYAPVDGFAPDEQVFLMRSSVLARHALFQVFVNPPAAPGFKKRLSLRVDMRSCDAPEEFPGVITGYGFLAHLLAHVLDMEATELLFTLGDSYIRTDQIEGVTEQLEREPRDAPKISFSPKLKDIFQIKASDIAITGYDPYPEIVYPVTK